VRFLTPIVLVLATSSLRVLAAEPPAKPSALEVVTAYAAAWAEPDEAARRALLEKAWADDGVYSDPTAHVEGREALVKHVAGFLATMKTAKLERASGVEVHHGSLRFAWRIVTPDGKVVGQGFDYGELAEDGRLSKIVGFFGPFPDLESSP
jgi:SnoaL-like protein